MSTTTKKCMWTILISCVSNPPFSLEAHALLYAVGPATCFILQAVCTSTKAAFLIALARESSGRLIVDTR